MDQIEQPPSASEPALPVPRRSLANIFARPMTMRPVYALLVVTIIAFIAFLNAPNYDSDMGGGATDGDRISVARLDEPPAGGVGEDHGDGEVGRA